MESRAARLDQRALLPGFLLVAAVLGFVFPAAPLMTMAILCLACVSVAAALAPELSLIAILFFMPLIPSWSDFSIFGLPRSLNFTRWAVLVIAVTLAGVVARTGFDRVRLRVWDVLFLGMYGMFLAVTILKRGFPGVLGFTSIHALPIAIYLSIKLLPLSWETLRSATIAVVLSGCVVAVSILYEGIVARAPIFAAPGLTYHWSAGRRLIFRPGGLMGSPPTSALFLAIAFLLAVALVRVVREQRSKAMLAGASGVIVFALVLTFTRSAWVGSIVGLLVLFSARLKNRMVVTSIVVIGLILAVGYGPWVSSFVFEAGVLRPGTIFRRFQLYDMSVKSFLSSTNPILGLGCQGIGLSEEANAREIGEFGTHDQYLQIVLEQGLVGLILFGSWIAIVLRRGHGVLRDVIAEGRNTAITLVLPGLCAVLIAYIFAHTNDTTTLSLVAMFGSLLGNQERLLREAPGD